MEPSIIIQPDGTRRLVEPQDDESFDLEELQAIVGGYIQLVTTLDDRYMICDEDGLSKQLPVNDLASIYAGQVIVGTVLICDKNLLT